MGANPMTIFLEASDSTVTGLKNMCPTTVSRSTATSEIYG
jgi:hypothetical protein